MNLKLKETSPLWNGSWNGIIFNRVTEGVILRLSDCHIDQHFEEVEEKKEKTYSINDLRESFEEARIFSGMNFQPKHRTFGEYMDYLNKKEEEK